MQHMLVLYYQAIKAVPETEEELLSKLLQELEASLDPGFNVLNWNSLGISDFNHQCRKAINEFNTRVGQVLKNKRDIEALVASISNATLVPESETSEVPTLQERFVATTCFTACVIRRLYQVSHGEGAYPEKCTCQSKMLARVTRNVGAGVLRHHRNPPRNHC